ncbi:MAG: glycosyltransferase family 4 protein [Actinomycetota bacterium]
MSEPRVLQVYPDDEGGGPVHVRMLREVLGSEVRWEEMPLDPQDLHRAGGWLRVPREVGRRLAGPPAIAHAQGVRTAAAVLLAARIRRSRFVVTIQGLHSIRRSRSPLVRILNRFVLSSADLVLVTGASDAKTIVEERLALSSKVRVIRPAFESRDTVDREAARRQLHLPKDATVVLWMGRFSPEKDPVTFARAISLIRSDSQIVAIMAGDGPLLSRVEAVVAREGLSDRLRLAGWLADPGPAVAASDLYVNTSLWEGMPHSALEAGGAGCALVMTDRPGNRDLVGAGVPAVLVPAGSAQRLASEIERLALDADRRAKMGKEAAGVIGRTFTLENLHDDVMSAYRELA